jgi:hypothetical protein
MMIFIDSSKRSLKAVRLPNDNNYALSPIGPSVHLRTFYENLEMVLNIISYTSHDWMICGDVKVLCMLVDASRSAGWLYQVLVFYLWMGQQSKKSTLGAKSLDTKGISWNWEQEYFELKSCRSEENTAASPSY